MSETSALSLGLSQKGDENVRVWARQGVRLWGSEPEREWDCEGLSQKGGETVRVWARKGVRLWGSEPERGWDCEGLSQKGGETVRVWARKGAPARKGWGCEGSCDMYLNFVARAQSHLRQYKLFGGRGIRLHTHTNLHPTHPQIRLLRLSYPHQLLELTFTLKCFVPSLCAYDPCMAG